MTQKPTITTVEQLRELDPAPCAPALEWLAENGITDMADAWDRCHRGDWMLWLDGALDLLTDRERRLIACRLVRETPLADGRKVWDLLADESRRAVAVAERYAVGEATDEELAAARVAANAARDAAWITASAAASAAAAAAAAYAAVDAAMMFAAAAAYAAAARAAAWAAQADIVRAIAGNPFR